MKFMCFLSCLLVSFTVISAKEFVLGEGYRCTEMTRISNLKNMYFHLARYTLENVK